uniref:Family with sequence similarity 49 member A, like n=1 Tax=Cynoglossus semilaevis TaxID=244447 RepID=A0A3P8VKQ8_CYNSE
MGNLLKVLACAELEHGPIVFLDFEHAQPTEAETAVWNQVSAVLEEAHGILAELQSYNGAGQEIREAIQNPGDLALQEKAWNAVCPLVAKLKRFYEFSLRLENALRSLLEALTSPPYAPMQHLEREQALAKQFAEILHFTLSFDELKMTNPAIQNDFSYYRRTISRNRLNNQQLEAENEVNNEMANRMSLFYAEATPMLKTLSNATTKFVSEVLLRLSPPSSPVRSSTHFGGRFTIMEKTFCHQFPSVTICQFRRSRNFPTSHLSAFSTEQKSRKDFRGVHKQFRGHVGSEMLFSKVTLRP